MRRRRLIWQLFPSYLLITLVALLAVTVYFSRSLRSFYERETVSNLEARAQLLELQVERLLHVRDYTGIDVLVKTLGTQSRTRITVILPDGRVVGDSDKDPVTMDNHRHRPEVEIALGSHLGSASRYSATLHEKMMYVALPLVRDSRIIGILRTSTPMEDIDRTLGHIYRRLVWAWLVIGVLAAVVSLGNARRVSRPLEAMRQRAEHIAEGDLEGRIPIEGSEEVSALAEAMNTMAEQLDDRIQTILRQGAEQEAVLASMIEGVIAVDTEERILSLNDAAIRQFGISIQPVRGRMVQEVIRNSELNSLVSRTLRSGFPTEGRITVFNGSTFTLQAHGAPLIDENGRRVGAVIVLNDITRLLAMERAQRDFVANVSHELKTPITSIQGFIETLMDGAKEDPGTTDRFLGIIHTHVERMNRIIDDLLQLARLERESDVRELVFEVMPLAGVLQTAKQVCAPRAGEKHITIELDCPPDLSARINPTLFEQAMVNYLDNAITYSEPDTTVQLQAVRVGGELEIRVIDQGIGIPEEHLPNLFKRFYRVEKSRSRKNGGTGLGLAIVKHVAIAHGGRVDVQSRPGHGSTFFFYLPAA